MKTEKINKAYFEDYPFSYGGKYRLYSYPKHIVDRALHQNDIYTRFFQHKRPKVYSPVYVWSKRELFECDTAYFTKKDMVEANNGKKFLLCIIDVFTKYVFLYPLKSIQCKDVIACFKDLFSKSTPASNFPKFTFGKNTYKEVTVSACLYSGLDVLFPFSVTLV